MMISTQTNPASTPTGIHHRLCQMRPIATATPVIPLAVMTHHAIAVVCDIELLLRKYVWLKLKNYFTIIYLLTQPQAESNPPDGGRSLPQKILVF